MQTRLLSSIQASFLAPVAMAALAGLGCGGHTRAPSAPEQPTNVQGVAVLEPRSGSNTTGEARLTDKGDGVELVLTIAGATPGRHGFHIHAVGDCSAPDAMTAGDHFNPDGAPHGAPGASPHHAGDTGNIEVGEDGTGTVTIEIPDVTLAPGPRSLGGLAVIVHAKEDDFQTQPAGDSGDRIACGVIKVGAAEGSAP